MLYSTVQYVHVAGFPSFSVCMHYELSMRNALTKTEENLSCGMETCLPLIGQMINGTFIRDAPSACVMDQVKNFSS